MWPVACMPVPHSNIAFTVCCELAARGPEVRLQRHIAPVLQCRGAPPLQRVTVSRTTCSPCDGHAQGAQTTICSSFGHASQPSADTARGPYLGNLELNCTSVDWCVATCTLPRTRVWVHVTYSACSNLDSSAPPRGMQATRRDVRWTSLGSWRKRYPPQSSRHFQAKWTSTVPQAGEVLGAWRVGVAPTQCHSKWLRDDHRQCHVETRLEVPVREYEETRGHCLRAAARNFSLCYLYCEVQLANPLVTLASQGSLHPAPCHTRCELQLAQSRFI